jgi:hypothetical protein
MPASVIAWTASYVRVPERETTPTRPSRWIDARDDADLGRAGRRGAGAVGPDEPGAGAPDHLDDGDHVQGRDALGDAEDRGDPGVHRLQHGIRCAAAGTKMHDVFARSRGRPRRRCRRRGRAIERGLAALARRDAGHDGGAVLEHGRLWNSPSRPVMPWTTSRVSRPTRMLMRRLPARPATAFVAPPRQALVAVSNRASGEDRAASSALVPTMRTTIGTSRSCWPGPR